MIAFQFENVCSLLCNHVRKNPKGFSARVLNGGWALVYKNNTLCVFDGETLVKTFPNCKLLWSIEIPKPLCDLQDNEGFLDYNRILAWAKVQHETPDFCI
jgi:hypothetical protein